MNWTKCDICNESCSKNTFKRYPDKVVEVKQAKGFTKYYHLECIKNSIKKGSE